MSQDDLLIELSMSEKTRFGKEDFVLQSFPQKVFSAIWALEDEVNNGGFSQYFLNYSNETASFVCDALLKIGAPQTAVICKRAIETAFPYGLPSDPEEIGQAASDFSDEIEDKLNDLDNEFFTYPHSLSDLLYKYVYQHPEEFGEVPQPVE